ncbi:hypothetical protein J4E83_001293 [Alternaria metachromatica]|uniref:uncharacterized protein n=1 Tax=Alternaria metachromatica TaxID=283354 RepID=UPI0020C23F1F|nr:uncharacterized protein J4E83_001293 [Alternaria metachromatica]KAI4636339.1 hypothetical protein J4E83_001293 [Alternaria metachromatica]
MFAQEYIPFATGTAPSTDERGIPQPTHLARKASSASSAFLRELLGPEMALSIMPPGCRTIAFSQWGGFTAAPEQVTPTGELKASDLYMDRGMTSTFNPPTSEWCYLGVNQPKPDPRYNVQPIPDLRKRKRNSSTSIATVSEQGDQGARPKPTASPVRFTRQTLKRVNTNSELTRSFELVSIKEEKKPTLAEKFAFEGLNCEDLPSAFDSDDEEEDYDIRHAR